MSPGPITSLAHALAASDTPAGRKVRSALGFPFLGGMLEEELAKIDESDPSELVSLLRSVASLTGTLAAQIEAGAELTAESVLATLERSVASDGASE